LGSEHLNCETDVHWIHCSLISIDHFNFNGNKVQTMRCIWMMNVWLFLASCTVQGV